MTDENYNYEKINLDMFGKKISLFFNGNEIDGTTFGKIMTFIYIGLYIILFLVFTILVILKKNGNYYDSEINPKELPEIKLNRDLLYFGFSLRNAKTHDSYLDESIYYPKAYYKQAKRENNTWKWKIEEIEIEKCKLEKFGKNYQNLFSNKPLDNLYCIKNLNQILKGHYIYDEYSLYSISIFPCINTTKNNNSCKSTKEIENKIENSLFTVEMESIGLNPKNFSYPAQPIAENLYTSIGNGFLREFHVFLEVIEVQTDKNIIFESVKKEKFLRYNKNIPMVSIKNNNIIDGNSVCDFELKLYDKIKVQKRSYTKIYSAFSNTGGVMIFIKGLIFLISFLPVQTLHELKVINKLFTIDKTKKELALTNLKKFKVIALKQSITSSFSINNNIKNKKDKLILTHRLKNNNEKGMLDIISKNSHQETYNNKINNENCDSNFKINCKPKKAKNSFSCFYRQSVFHENDDNSASNLFVNKKNEKYRNDYSRLKLIPENNNNNHINIISRINQIDVSKTVDNINDINDDKNLKKIKLKIDNVNDFSIQKDKIGNNKFIFTNYLKRQSLNRIPQMIRKNNSDKIIFNLNTKYTFSNSDKSNNNIEKTLKLSYLETYFVGICKTKMKNKNNLLFEEITNCYRKFLDVIKIFRNQIVFDRIIENNINIEKPKVLKVLNYIPENKSRISAPQFKGKII